MKKQTAQIKEFSELFGFNVHPEPQIPSAEVITLRDTLIREEVDELLEASKNGDIVEAADAIGDILYILLGTACEYGLIDKLEDVFDLIHGNNMKKVWPDGKVHKREDGKVLKPEGFEKVTLSTLFQPPLSSINLGVPCHRCNREIATKYYGKNNTYPSCDYCYDKLNDEFDEEYK